jgi:hypothetical protein
MNVYTTSKSARATVDRNLSASTKHETNERRRRSRRSLQLDTLATADTRTHPGHRRLTNARLRRGNLLYLS